MLLWGARHLLHAIQAVGQSGAQGGPSTADVLLQGDDADDEDDLSPERKLVYVCCALLLTLLAGLMSGLTLGLMSLDTVELEVMRISGTPSQKRSAAVIIPLVNNHNFLLVTLLLCNAAATETLPLFIDRLADPFTAVIVSVTVVLTFGEILPQAVCGKYGLEVGASCAWLVRILMLLSAPVSWPVGKLLDFILGSHHAEMFRRSQLMALVDLHGSMSGFGGSLTEAEVLVIKGALDLTAKTASKSMTPLDKVFMLSTEDRLDERTIEAILISGHSRIPVYKDRNRSNIVGLIMIKEMVLVDPADHLPVSSLNIRELPQLPADTPMYDMLKVFESGKSHMALLTAPRGSISSASSSSENPSLRDGRGWGRDSKSRAGSEQGTPPHHRGGLSAALDSLVAGLNTFFTARSHHRVPQDEETGFISRQSSSLTFGGGGLGEPSFWQGHHEPVGIITIEDVIEELLQQEIIDETDQYIDNMQTSHVDGLLVAQGLPPRLQRYLNTGMFAPRMTLLGAKQRMTAAPLKDIHSTINRIAYEDPSRRQAAQRQQARRSP